MIDIPVGTVLKREALHQQYGGSGQGGICSAPKSNAIFLFADPERAKRHGYVDGWGEDGRYHYCGQGRVGDQAFTVNNKAVLNHVALGRNLYLFEVVKPTLIRLIGEFTLDKTMPYYFRDGIDDHKEQRQMIVFCLNPAGEAIAPLSAPSAGPEFIPASTPQCEFVPIEQHLTEEYSVSAPKDTNTARRREAELVTAYVKHLATQGHEVSRHKLVPPGESAALRTDIFDHTDNILIEAKGDTSRSSVRMAVGQLLDYQRLITPRPRLATLFPVAPRDDLRDFCATINIATIWRDGKSFQKLEPPSWHATSH